MAFMTSILFGFWIAVGFHTHFTQGGVILIGYGRRIKMWMQPRMALNMMRTMEKTMNKN